MSADTPIPPDPQPPNPPRRERTRGARCGPSYSGVPIPDCTVISQADFSSLPLILDFTSITA
ncbi:hypothetical protein SFR_6930 (plasmid) [Streptomyces sp. FR-008]|nr:hypothetical protein SFR_6930 [Streptomyces sp. FR-008]